MMAVVLVAVSIKNMKLIDSLEGTESSHARILKYVVRENGHLKHYNRLTHIHTPRTNLLTILKVSVSSEDVT